MTARVVIDAKCPLCGGIGTRGLRRCLVCHGTGTAARQVTCETCRWWVRDKDYWHWADDEAYCVLAECDEVRETKYPDAPHHVKAREGGELLTNATFGCAAWEARE